MANALNMNINGKYVVLKEKVYKGNMVSDRVFYCDGGFGADNITVGRAVFGHFAKDKTSDRVNGYDIERLATEQEIDAALKNQSNTIFATMDFEKEEDIVELSKELHKLLTKKHPCDYPKVNIFLKKIDEKVPKSLNTPHD